ncbi:MAG: ATP-binding protein [Desulfobacteraceae bacterium]|nr:ATP-binding protein [Desulfobacteraceae bacterium]
MIKSILKAKSIVSKLTILNGIIIMAFGCLILVNFALTSQMKNMVITLVDHGVSQAITNQELGAKLQQLSSDIHFFVKRFAIEGMDLQAQSERLLTDLNNFVVSAQPNESFSEDLKIFASAFKALLGQCAQVEEKIQGITAIENQLTNLLDRIEDIVTNELIQLKLNGKEYEINSINQISALIPDLRLLLLKIKITLNESERAHFTREVAITGFEERLLEMVSDMESSLSAVSTAGEHLAPSGKEAMGLVAALKEKIAALHGAMRVLRANLVDLYASQDKVIARVEAVRQTITTKTTKMKETVVSNVRSFGSIMGLLSLLVIGVSVLVTLYGVRITKPIQHLTRSTAIIASGDLDKEIRVQGDDEIAALSQSFIKMRDSIREKIKDLGKKNEAMTHEIELRVKTEEQLRKYESIVAASKDLMAIVNTDCVYTAVNDAHTILFKKNKPEIIGKSMAEIAGAAFFNVAIKPNFTKCCNDEEVNFQTWFDFPEIGRRYMDVAFYPYKDRDDKIIGSVLNARDVTQIKMLETKLNQSQKMEAIGTLAGGIAHDFNNILGAILGYTELLLLEVTQEGEIREWLNHVFASAQRAKDLVQQILAFSRQSEQQKKPLKLEPLVEEAIKMIRASIPTTIEIQKDIKPTKGTVLADPTQIHQVLLNLCTNSAHAMREKGGILSIGLQEIRINADSRLHFPALKEKEYMKLTVSDTGHGIPQEDIGRIFEPYFTTKEKGLGTGLGLATVHGIIQSYEGTIDVSSVVGRGTTFTVYIPKCSFGAEQFALTKTQPISLPRGQGRILLVDDEASLVAVSKQMLARMGYEVHPFSEATEALACFKANPNGFDLVITDQTMPGMTGQELSEHVMKAHPGIPIILCTGFSELINEEKAKAMGIREYLKKPVTLQKLGEAIRRALGADSQGQA